MYLWLFFFFSSRRRHTRSFGDWSSDVCSSDLGSQIKKIIFTATTKAPDDCRALFRNLKSLTEIVGLEELDTSDVTEMSAMFKSCSSLKSLDLSSFNTSKVTTMRDIFSHTRLSSLTLGDKVKDLGDDADLSAPSALTPGDDLTGNWTRQDGNSKSYSTKDF